MHSHACTGRGLLETDSRLKACCDTHRLSQTVQNEYHEHKEYKPVRDHRHVLLRGFFLLEDVAHSGEPVI